MVFDSCAWSMDKFPCYVEKQENIVCINCINSFGRMRHTHFKIAKLKFQKLQPQSY